MSPEQDYVIVIPARYDSQRLPGKVLIEIGGKTMLQHVWERARESAAAEVIVATDDERILSACESFGAAAVMTDQAHRSGSDRIAQVARQQGWDDSRIVVNLQGDEPMMPAACLDQVATLAGRFPAADAATLYCPLDDLQQANDPNIVKVVTDAQGRALLFSRSPIPYYRGGHWPAAAGWKRHIGLYAYRAGSLKQFAASPASHLESAESLEQLRYLENGGSIVLEPACLPIPPGVDTKDDLDKLSDFLT
ncbi:MAG: 3-deoxy-manno-octulosonate cytidylyltransferase [Xanthomonadales bacterium]|nr:3-deoxy-manno-octulosonate cytidylyltransferase [Xanthomonadales bacterium]